MSRLRCTKPIAKLAFMLALLATFLGLYNPLGGRVPFTRSFVGVYLGSGFVFWVREKPEPVAEETVRRYQRQFSGWHESSGAGTLWPIRHVGYDWGAVTFPFWPIGMIGLVVVVREGWSVFTRLDEYFGRLPNPDRHRCSNCDYNLRGNTSGRCPECGLDIPSAFGSHRDRRT